jgi:hypothetical protein
VTDTPPESEPTGSGVDAPSDPPATAVRSNLTAMLWDVAKPQYLALLIGLVVLGVIGLSGGWSSVEGSSDTVRSASVGTSVTANPFTVTVKKALWTEDSIKGLIYAEPGVRSLMVSVEVTNTASDPVSTLTLGNTFRIGAEGLIRFGKEVPSAKAGPVLMRAADFKSATYAQPDLPTRLILIWQQSDRIPPPSNVVVTLRKHTWRASVLGGGMDWFDTTEVATITLPVTEFQP